MRLAPTILGGFGSNNSIAFEKNVDKSLGHRFQPLAINVPKPASESYIQLRLHLILFTKDRVESCINLLLCRSSKVDVML